LCWPLRERTPKKGMTGESPTFRESHASRSEPRTVAVGDACRAVARMPDAILRAAMGWTAWRHALAGSLSLILMAVEAPVLHRHGGDAPAIFDDACPLAQLAASGSEAGLIRRVDLAQSSPMIDVAVCPACPVPSVIAVIPFDPRGPPPTV